MYSLLFNQLIDCDKCSFHNRNYKMIEDGQFSDADSNGDCQIGNTGVEATLRKDERGTRSQLVNSNCSEVHYLNLLIVVLFDEII